MAVWVVGGGRKGEQQREEEALEKGVLAIRFAGMQKVDLTNVLTRPDVKRLYVLANPDESAGRIGQRVRSLWLFRVKIQIGDRVLMPLRRQSIIAVGEVTGDYGYCQEFPHGFVHRRTVKWANKEAPRSALSEKCNRSINRPPTVSDISTYAEELDGLFVN